MCSSAAPAQVSRRAAPRLGFSRLRRNREDSWEARLHLTLTCHVILGFSLKSYFNIYILLVLFSQLASVLTEAGRYVQLHSTSLGIATMGSSPGLRPSALQLGGFLASSFTFDSHLARSLWSKPKNQKKKKLIFCYNTRMFRKMW